MLVQAQAGALLGAACVAVRELPDLEAQVGVTQRITMLRRQLGGVSADGTSVSAPGALSSILRAARQELICWMKKG